MSTSTTDPNVSLVSSQATPETSEENGGPEVKPIEYRDIGVWTVMREVNTSWTIQGLPTIGRAKDFVAAFPFIYRFLRECFSVGPKLITIYTATSLWESTKSTVDLYYSSRLLDLIQDSILYHRVDRKALLIAVVSRILLTFINSVVGQARHNSRTILANRVRYLFEGRLLEACMRLDLPTYEDADTSSKITGLMSRYGHGGPWGFFEELLQKVRSLASVFSQVGFLVSVLRSQPGSRLFAALCLTKSIVESVTYTSYRSTPSYTWASNKHYRRIIALNQIGLNENHKIEVISNVLVNYIKREWKKARELLHDASDEHPSSVLRKQESFASTFLDHITDDFPLIFYACQVMFWPGSFSLTSVALMQQASASLAWTISRIVTGEDTIVETLDDIKGLYETSDIQNNLEDGELYYPPDNDASSPGMELTFKDVSFAYPGSDTVIRNVSFTIGRGQTVIIVGVNGSGKSTLLKLFNRLYDPTEGSVHIDEVPMTSFHAEDLRRASAILLQNYSHFPLSIRENISMGLPEMISPSAQSDDESDDPVREAARLGGAEGFVVTQSDGFDTVLKTHWRLKGWSSGDPNTSEEFKRRVDDIKRTAEVSYGQWQRLALSRLFFRAVDSSVKLIAVDEPSASLDPDMEYELFERLKELSSKKGKTVVFVTHRFGHLTKQADLILVMKNGCLVEQGKHNELLKMDGEYAKLYKKQADAFLPTDDHE